MKRLLGAMLLLATLAHAVHAAEATPAVPVPPPAAPPPPPATVPATTAAPATAAPAAAAPAQDVANLVQEFSEQREAELRARQAQLERLKKAKTEEERQRIVAELRADQQRRVEQQREQARLIREQAQRVRRDAVTRPGAR